MRCMLAIAGLITLATPSLAAEPAAADRRQLLQLAERMDQAWTAGDAAANAQLFDAEATARFGEDPLGEGREAIRRQFDGFFAGRPAGLRHVTRIERIEQLASDLAQWDAEVRVERRAADGRWTTLSRIRNVTIAIRQGEGWRIKSVRAFPVTP